MNAITIANLSKSFRGRPALRGIDLTISEGEMVALIGASGSGKSTLLRHIAGLERADRGSGAVAIFGRAIQDRGRLTGEARAIRRGVGVVFQQFNLVGRLPVLTNVLIGCLGRIPGWRGILGAFPRDEVTAAMAALARVGIAEKARQRASQLSGGQQQRAAIARTLLQGARTILADEPIASLDPASARRVMETLAAVNRDDGATVLVTLHQVGYARRYCPRTIALAEGRVVFDGPTAALTDDALRALYGAAGEELIAPDQAGDEPVLRPAPAYRLATA